MQFDVIWLLLALPLAFVLGWLASRFDFRQLRLQNRRSPRAYFRGLNHLLQNKNDAAVADFKQAVRNDPDTPELQFALGHLFRERGEYTPAVHLHEHLLMRADLSAEERARAQYALALDYTRAGILDRAESALSVLEGTPYEAQSRQIRLAIYERLRDWEHAAGVAQLLRTQQAALYTRRQVHYWCEQAKDCADAKVALALLQKAQSHDATAARPLIELARLYLHTGDGAQAAQAFAALQQLNPQWLALIAHDYVRVWNSTGNCLKPHINLPEQLLKVYQAFPLIDVLDALAQLGVEGQEYAQAQGLAQQDAESIYLQHLRAHPSLLAASRWLAGRSESSSWPAEVQRTLERASKPLLRYRCSACGFEGERHYWHCPGCQAWDAYAPLRVEDL